MDRWRNEWMHEHMNKRMHEIGEREERRRLQSATV